MSNQNKLLVRQLIEDVWNQGNFTVVDEFIASDYLGHGALPAEETHGRDGYRRFYATLRGAFAGLQATVEDQVAEGDRVVTRWTCRGTHDGEFQGSPPTGQQGSVSGITIDRIVDGKIVECWTSMDELGLLRQLGVIPLSAHGERKTEALPH